jgi:hypothetical protein
MTRLFILPVLLITLLLGTPAVAADFQKGLDAWNKKDYATALREWRPLAERGHARSQVNLGWMYYLGQGVTKDYKTAVKWDRLAAEQKNARAQNYLGIMYYRGEGVIRDYVLAHMWWNIAASQGVEEAKKNRAIVEKTMTPADISNAQKLARECVKKKYEGC